MTYRRQDFFNKLGQEFGNFTSRERLGRGKTFQTTSLMGSTKGLEAFGWSEGGKQQDPFYLSFSNGEFSHAYVCVDDQGKKLRTGARWTRIELFGVVIWQYFDCN